MIMLQSMIFMHRGPLRIMTAEAALPREVEQKLAVWVFFDPFFWA